MTLARILAPSRELMTPWRGKTAREKAYLMNSNFANIGKNLANALPKTDTPCLGRNYMENASLQLSTLTFLR